MSWSPAVQSMNAACISSLGGESVYWIPAGPDLPFNVDLIVSEGIPAEQAIPQNHVVADGERRNFLTKPAPGDTFRRADGTEYEVHDVKDDAQKDYAGNVDARWVTITALKKLT
jgi:hypothetical protein